jgi:hypothetical protein
VAEHAVEDAEYKGVNRRGVEGARLGEECVDAARAEALE